MALDTPSQQSPETSLAITRMGEWWGSLQLPTQNTMLGLSDLPTVHEVNLRLDNYLLGQNNTPEISTRDALVNLLLTHVNDADFGTFLSNLATQIFDGEIPDQAQRESELIRFLSVLFEDHTQHLSPSGAAGLRGIGIDVADSEIQASTGRATENVRVADGGFWREVDDVIGSNTWLGGGEQHTDWTFILRSSSENLPEFKAEAVTTGEDALFKELKVRVEKAKTLLIQLENLNNTQKLKDDEKAKLDKIIRIVDMQEVAMETICGKWVYAALPEDLKAPDGTITQQDAERIFKSDFVQNDQQSRKLDIVMRFLGTAAANAGFKQFMSANLSNVSRYLSQQEKRIKEGYLNSSQIIRQANVPLMVGALEALGPIDEALQLVPIDIDAITIEFEKHKVTPEALELYEAYTQGLGDYLQRVTILIVGDWYADSSEQKNRLFELQKEIQAQIQRSLDELNNLKSLVQKISKELAEKKVGQAKKFGQSYNTLARYVDKIELSNADEVRNKLSDYFANSAEPNGRLQVKHRVIGLIYELSALVPGMPDQSDIVVLEQMLEKYIIIPANLADKGSPELARLVLHEIMYMVLRYGGPVTEYQNSELLPRIGLNGPYISDELLPSSLSGLSLAATEKSLLTKLRTLNKNKNESARMQESDVAIEQEWVDKFRKLQASHVTNGSNSLKWLGLDKAPNLGFSEDSMLFIDKFNDLSLLLDNLANPRSLIPVRTEELEAWRKELKSSFLLILFTGIRHMVPEQAGQDLITKTFLEGVIFPTQFELHLSGRGQFDAFATQVMPSLQKSLDPEIKHFLVGKFPIFAEIFEGMLYEHNRSQVEMKDALLVNDLHQEEIKSYYRHTSALESLVSFYKVNPPIDMVEIGKRQLELDAERKSMSWYESLLSSLEEKKRIQTARQKDLQGIRSWERPGSTKYLDGVEVGVKAEVVLNNLLSYQQSVLEYVAVGESKVDEQDKRIKVIFEESTQRFKTFYKVVTTNTDRVEPENLKRVMDVLGGDNLIGARGRAINMLLQADGYTNLTRVINDGFAALQVEGLSTEQQLAILRQIIEDPSLPVSPEHAEYLKTVGFPGVVGDPNLSANDPVLASEIEIQELVLPNLPDTNITLTPIPTFLESTAAAFASAIPVASPNNTPTPASIPAVPTNSIGTPTEVEVRPALPGDTSITGGARPVPEAVNELNQIADQLWNLGMLVSVDDIQSVENEKSYKRVKLKRKMSTGYSLSGVTLNFDNVVGTVEGGFHLIQIPIQTPLVFTNQVLQTNIQTHNEDDYVEYILDRESKGARIDFGKDPQTIKQSGLTISGIQVLDVSTSGDPNIDLDVDFTNPSTGEHNPVSVTDKRLAGIFPDFASKLSTAVFPRDGSIVLYTKREQPITYDGHECQALRIVDENIFAIPTTPPPLEIQIWPVPNSAGSTSPVVDSIPAETLQSDAGLSPEQARGILERERSSWGIQYLGNAELKHDDQGYYYELTGERIRLNKSPFTGVVFALTKLRLITSPEPDRSPTVIMEFANSSGIGLPIARNFSYVNSAGKIRYPISDEENVPSEIEFEKPIVVNLHGVAEVKNIKSLQYKPAQKEWASIDTLQTDYEITFSDEVKFTGQFENIGSLKYKHLQVSNADVNDTSKLEIADGNGFVYDGVTYQYLVVDDGELKLETADGNVIKIWPENRSVVVSDPSPESGSLATEAQKVIEIGQLVGIDLSKSELNGRVQTVLAELGLDSQAPAGMITYRGDGATLEFTTAVELGIAQDCPVSRLSIRFVDEGIYKGGVRIEAYPSLTASISAGEFRLSGQEIRKLDLDRFYGEMRLAEINISRYKELDFPPLKLEVNSIKFTQANDLGFGLWGIMGWPEELGYDLPEIRSIGATLYKEGLVIYPRVDKYLIQSPKLIDNIIIKEGNIYARSGSDEEQIWPLLSTNESSGTARVEEEGNTLPPFLREDNNINNSVEFIVHQSVSGGQVGRPSEWIAANWSIVEKLTPEDIKLGSNLWWLLASPIGSEQFLTGSRLLDDSKLRVLAKLVFFSARGKVLSKGQQPFFDTAAKLLGEKFEPRLDFYGDYNKIYPTRESFFMAEVLQIGELDFDWLEKNKDRWTTTYPTPGTALWWGMVSVLTSGIPNIRKWERSQTEIYLTLAANISLSALDNDHELVKLSSDQRSMVDICFQLLGGKDAFIESFGENIFYLDKRRLDPPEVRYAKFLGKELPIDQNIGEYLKLLGIGLGEGGAAPSEAEIKQAYRKLAREFHPDTNNAADAALKMQLLNEAYAKVLEYYGYDKKE